MDMFKIFYIYKYCLLVRVSGYTVCMTIIYFYQATIMYYQATTFISAICGSKIYAHELSQPIEGFSLTLGGITHVLH